MSLPSTASASSSVSRPPMAESVLSMVTTSLCLSCLAASGPGLGCTDGLEMEGLGDFFRPRIAARISIIGLHYTMIEHYTVILFMMILCIVYQDAYPLCGTTGTWCIATQHFIGGFWLGRIHLVPSYHLTYHSQSATALQYNSVTRLYLHNTSTHSLWHLFYHYLPKVSVTPPSQ